MIENLQASFFSSFDSIVAQLKQSKTKEVAEFLLNCLRWKFSAKDHPLLANSMIVEVLRDGNGIARRDRNLIRYQWGKTILKPLEHNNPVLARSIVNTLECIASSAISKIITEETKEEQVLAENPEEFDATLVKKTSSMVNFDATQKLLTKCFDVVFRQVNRYSELLRSFDPIDWKLFVKNRNEYRGKVNPFQQDGPGILEDEKTQDEIEEDKQVESKREQERENERLEETKQEGAIPRDRIREILADKTEKEMKKVNSLYDQDTITKLLRLLDMFTSVALLNSNLRYYVLKTTNAMSISNLLRLALVCQQRHGVIIANILKNLSELVTDVEMLNDAVDHIMDDEVARRLVKLPTKVEFSNSKFVQFVFNLILSIRAKQWDKRAFSGYGSYDFSCCLVRLFHSLMRNKIHTEWITAIENALDHFLENIDSYSIEEFDVMVSLLEGGEHLGLNVGAYGMNKEKETFTVIGFVKEWYDLKTPNSVDNYNFQVFNISTEITNEKDYALVLIQNKEDPSKNTLNVVAPEDITLIPDLKRNQSSYLLDKERLSKFITALQIDTVPDKHDAISLTKRCIGMKILVNLIDKHAAKMSFLLEAELKHKLIGIMVEEYTSSDQKGAKMKEEWLDQKLYLLKKYATEMDVTLRKQLEAYIRFSGQTMSLSKPLKSSAKETFSQCIFLSAAMNYGRLEVGVNYKVIENEHLNATRYHPENIAILESSQCDSVEKLREIFRHVDTIVTADIDIRKLHQQLKDHDKDIAYFKTIVLIDKSDIDSLNKTIYEDPDVKVGSTDDMNLNEAFLSEVATFLKFDTKELRELLKGNEDAALSKKVSILTEMSKKKSSKKEEVEEEKQKELEKEPEWYNMDEGPHTEENNYTQVYGLQGNDKFDERVNQLAAYDSENYNLDANQANQTDMKFYDKVYREQYGNVELEYLETLGSLYKQLCKKTISVFSKDLNIQEILNITLETSNSLQKFASYMLLKGNEAATEWLNTRNDTGIEEFVDLMTKLINSSKEKKEFKDLIDIIYKKCIIRHNIETLATTIKSGGSSVAVVYDSDTVSTKTLNVLLVPKLINVIRESKFNMLYGDATEFSNLLTMLFMIPLAFRTEFHLQKEVYTCIYKLLVPIVKNPDNYSFDLKKGILRLRIFQRMIDKCNFDVTVTGGNRLTSEQKLLFEIFTLIHKIDSTLSDAWSLYTYTDTLLELEKSREILKEGKEFDLISYLMYFNNELSGPQQHTKVYADTFHSMFDCKISAKVYFEGFKKMTFRLDDVSKIEKDTFICVSSDPNGESILKKISQKDIDNGNTSINIYFNQCYIHYPYCPPRILGFGQAYNSELGNNNNGVTLEPMEFVDMMIPVKTIKTAANYTVVLDYDGQLHYCGDKTSFQKYNSTMKKYHKKLPEEKIMTMVACHNTILALTEDGKIYFEGYDSQYHYNSYDTQHYDFKHKVRPNEENEIVTDIDIGYNFHMYITDNGKLYASGNALLALLNLNNDTGNYTEISLGENVVPKSVICSKSEEYNKCAFVLVEVDGKSQLWSGGNSSYGLLGHGEGITACSTFSVLSYDTEAIVFKDLAVGEMHALAVTNDGQLFGWGCNSQKQLGMSDTKDYYSPTKIPFFENYIVQSLNVGTNFSIVRVSPKDNLEKSQVYYLGEVTGVSREGITDEGILHLQRFDDSDIKLIETGKYRSMFVYDGEAKASANVGVHYGYTCDVTGESPIQGTMHFYKDNNNNWHFLSKEGYEKEKQSLPEICFVTKYYIQDIQNKPWPELNPDLILEESKDVYEPSYLASVTVDGEKVRPMSETNEVGIFEREAHDINPLVFYRITKPIKDGSSLPDLALENYHKKTELFGIRVEADPDYSFQKNDVMISLEYDRYVSMQERIKLFDEQYDAELLTQIENNLTMMQQNFLECPFVFLMAAELEFENPMLRTLPTENVQSRIDSLVMFNQYLLKSLPFLYFDERIIHEDKKGETELQSESLTSCFILGKQFALENIKTNYLKAITDRLPSANETPYIDIDTSKVKKKIDEGKPDTKGEWSTFALCFKKAKEKKYEILRRSQGTSSSWYANFTNFGKQDDGTFRNSLSMITDELHSSVLPLFIPSNNNVNKEGPYQDRWVINPSCTSPSYLEMYKFVGALIGMAFRSGNPLDFRFAPFFWKKFLCDPLKLEDLESFDNKTASVLKGLRDKLSGKSQDAAALQKHTFTTELSNGTTLHLVENGDEEIVTDDRIQEYIDLVLDARFKESQKQMDAIKAGFDIVFPGEVARFLNWVDVETKVRGQEFNLDKLKQYSNYSSMSETDEYGNRFWNVIKSFTNEEKRRYLRYVSGRTRLPNDNKIADLYHKVYLKEAYEFSNHDEASTEAYRYNFQIYLPRYTTQEILKKKLLEDIENSEKYYLYGKGDGDVVKEEPLKPLATRRESTIEGSMPSSPRPVERRNRNELDLDSDISDSDDEEYDGVHSRAELLNMMRQRAQEDSDDSSDY